jgi:NADPH:quinone reductase-like Zn-dependent oxidoreductase
VPRCWPPVAVPLIIQFDEVGGPDNLRFREVPLTAPGPGEVRYVVHAFALNRGDLFWLADTYYNSPELPARIGQEACGIVDAVGAGVSEFKIGDRVCSLVQEEGRYCVNGEFAITPERYLVPWPKGLPAAQACALWSQALTAYYPLVELAAVHAGQYVLVTAGSSTSGNGAIQMARLLGARVLTTSRSLEKRDFLLALGAQAVIATDREDVGERIRQETDGHGVDIVFDTVAGSLMPRYLEGLASGARIFIVGALEGRFELSGPIIALIRSGASITGFSIFNHNLIDAQLARAKWFIGDAIAGGRLTAVIDRIVPFQKTVEAYRFLQTGRQRGKVVVQVCDVTGEN